MSTAPTGYQNPKTNWVAADAPGPADFNRIEGDLYAIESGNRTLDPALAGASNLGTLRQILSWIAGRIKGITGAANWFDAPAITLSGAKDRLDSADENLIDHSQETTAGTHGSAVAATANTLMHRDSVGRSKVAAPAATDDIAQKATVDTAVTAVQRQMRVRGILGL